MGLLLVCVCIIYIVYLLFNSSLCEANKISQAFAYISGFIAGTVALITYLENSSIKRMKFVDQVYKKFNDDNIL